jgi:hypothetical protein
LRVTVFSRTFIFDWWKPSAGGSTEEYEIAVLYDKRNLMDFLRVYVELVPRGNGLDFGTKEAGHTLLCFIPGLEFLVLTFITLL